jgi:MoxR-like ATPase
MESTPGEDIRGGLETFMATYPECRSRPFGTDKQLWSVLSHMRQRLETLPSIARRPTVNVTWSVGQGSWARVPWVAFLDERVTDTTQRGIYVVLLFREDMSGVYITFNQGVTESKKVHGGTAGLQLLRERAAALREKCDELSGWGFQLDNEIDLRTEQTWGRDYEAATIAYKLYERDAVPGDHEINRDLEALLAAYETQIITPLGDIDGEGRSIPLAPTYTMLEALDELFLTQPELDDLLTLWRTKKNLLLQGPPGVGKTFIARRLAFLMMGHRDQARMRMVQFHQAYAYEDFIQGYRPSETGGFIRRDGAFFDFAKLAEADPDRPYVFIIDEINRGNLSKILGELMMLIEPDKRGPEYAIPLAYSRPDEPPFSVPRNLILVGLMNTADRSLAMVDYALRRRFAFCTLEPKFDSEKFRKFLEARGANAALINVIVTRLTALNSEISSDKIRLGAGYQIGHSFFAPADEGQAFDAAWYHRVIQYEISPLLTEYWIEAPEKAAAWTATLCEGVG